MTLNFDDYQIVMQARKSRKFKELDDKVRAMTIELGKGNKSIDKKEYKELLQKRDQELRGIWEVLAPQVETFDRTTYQKIDSKITQKLNAYIAKYPNTKLQNIVLMGATGTGKTYCAQLIAHEISDKGYSVNFTSTFNLVKRMADHLYGQDNTALSDFVDSNLLIIDDLGAEPSTKNSDELIYTVINERYAAKKPFIITTNLSKEQIMARYDARICGRIFDKARTADIKFNGKDLRIE